MTIAIYGRTWKLAPQRVTRLAIWSRRFGTMAVPLAVIGVVFHRSGAADGVAGLAILAVFVICALLGLLAGMLALVRIWQDGLEGVSAAVMGIVWSIAVLIIPATLIPPLFTLPRLNQALTDFDDPPRFIVTSRNIPPGENAPNNLPPNQQALQRQAYPTVVPLRADLPIMEAYELALQLVESRGWEIVARSPPREINVPKVEKPQPVRPGRRAPNVLSPRPTQAEKPGGVKSAPKEYSAATIEAIARTRFYGFRDDVLIRLTPIQNETRVDMRSASRVGEFDFGANARRIVDFLTEFRDRAAER